MSSIDLSKILAEQTKILEGGQKVVITDGSMGVSQLLGGRAPELPRKSTPMMSYPSHPIEKSQNTIVAIMVYIRKCCRPMYNINDDV